MRRRSWFLSSVVVVLGAAGCEDLIVGTETGNPNPRMGDVEDMMPTMPTSRPVDIVDMPAPGMDEPGTNEGGAGSDLPTPSVSGSAPSGNPGGMGPGVVTPPGGTPGVVMPPGGQGAMPMPGFPGIAGATGVAPDGCEDQCSSQATASVAPLTLAAPAPMPFVAAECVNETCSCTTAQGMATTLPLAGDCALSGRGRNCLIASSELVTCDEAILDSCADACAQAEAALLEDADHVREVSVESWNCDTGSCQFVVNIDGECFEDYGTEPVECVEGALLGTEIMDSGAP